MTSTPQRLRLTDHNFRLETHFARWEFKARFHLTASDAQSMTLAELLGMATDEEHEAFERLWLGYTETPGSPALRDRIADTYRTRLADDILCFAGAEEGIFVAMHALLEPDDHVVVLTPNYQSVESVPLSICEASAVPLDASNEWSLDLAAVRAALRPNTKLLSINFPHNPTGRIIPHEQLEALVDLCRARGIWIFSDEVYRSLGLYPDRQLPQVADIYERGLSLNVMSKAYGLPGLRIGWIATADRALLARMERFKHYLSICNSAPSEALAMIALRNRERILARNNALLATNIELLDEFFAAFPDLFEWRRPDGGCVGYPRYLGPEGVDEFTDGLVERSGVLLLPSRIFQSDLGPTPTDRFRIGYGRANLAEGLTAFRADLLRNAV